MTQPKTPEPCPVCKGKCCRDEDYGYKVEHMGAECYEHTCEACLDGDKYIPPRTAEDERAAILVWLREYADIAWEPASLQIADAIERGEHMSYLVHPRG